MSIFNSILEGLRDSRMISESSFEDTPTSAKPREMQKIASDILSKKYSSLFKDYGLESMGVEVYVHGDDESMIEDAIYEITIYIAFDIKKKVDVKAVKSIIDKNMRNYPRFQYDKGSNQFYATVDEYSDIIDVIDTLERDGCKISKFYSIESASDIEDKVNRQMDEWRRERESEQREYDRSRL